MSFRSKRSWTPCSSGPNRESLRKKTSGRLMKMMTQLQEAPPKRLIKASKITGTRPALNHFISWLLWMIFGPMTGLMGSSDVPKILAPWRLETRKWNWYQLKGLISVHFLKQVLNWLAFLAISPVNSLAIVSTVLDIQLNQDYFYNKFCK